MCPHPAPTSLPNTGALVPTWSSGNRGYDTPRRPCASAFFELAPKLESQSWILMCELGDQMLHEVLESCPPQAETDAVLPFYLDALLWPLVSQQEPASTMGGAGETSEETSGQIC